MQASWFSLEKAFEPRMNTDLPRQVLVPSGFTDVQRVCIGNYQYHFVSCQPLVLEYYIRGYPC